MLGSSVAVVAGLTTCAGYWPGLTAVVATNLIHGRNPGDLGVPRGAESASPRRDSRQAANESEAELTHSKADLIGEAALHRHQVKQIKRRTTDGQ